MNIGMLWFDNDPKAAFSTKIERAASYYRNKYGRMPNLCYVHPSTLSENLPLDPQKPVKSGSVEVRTSRSVLPNHFWIGINGTNPVEA